MVKAYLRYESRDTWGVITTSTCNIAFDGTGKLLYTGCLENVGVWNVRQGALVRLLERSSHSALPQYTNGPTARLSPRSCHLPCAGAQVCGRAANCRPAA